MSQINILNIKLTLLSILFFLSCTRERKKDKGFCINNDNLEIIINIIESSNLNFPISIFENKEFFKNEDFFERKKCDRDCIDISFTIKSDTILIDNEIEIVKEQFNYFIKKVSKEYLCLRKSPSKLGNIEVNLGLMYNLHFYIGDKKLQSKNINNKEMKLLLNLIENISCVIQEIREEYSELAYKIAYSKLDHKNKELIDESIQQYFNLFIIFDNGFYAPAPARMINKK